MGCLVEGAEGRAEFSRAVQGTQGRAGWRVLSCGAAEGRGRVCLIPQGLVWGEHPAGAQCLAG